MARGMHGLPKVSPGPAMPYLSTPCRRATAKTAFCLFIGWPACRAGGLRLSPTPLDTPRHTGLAPSYVYISNRLPSPETNLDEVLLSFELLLGEFHDQGDNVEK
jgi:hypothetical protein